MTHSRAVDSGQVSPIVNDDEDEFVEASEIEPWLQQRDWQFSLHCSGIAARQLNLEESEVASVRVLAFNSDHTVR